MHLFMGLFDILLVCNSTIKYIHCIILIASFSPYPLPPGLLLKKTVCGYIFFLIIGYTEKYIYCKVHAVSCNYLLIFSDGYLPLFFFFFFFFFLGKLISVLLVHFLSVRFSDPICSLSFCD
jgi:hypothetical protein